MEPTLDQSFVQEEGAATQPVPALADRIMLLLRQPRLAFRTFLEHHAREHIFALFFLGALSEALNNAIERTQGESWSMPLVLLIGLVAAALSAFIVYPLMAALLAWTGRWIGGTAHSMRMQTVLAWSVLPNIASMGLWLPLYLLFGANIITGLYPFAGPFEQVLYAIQLLVGLALAIWSVVLLVIGLSEVHGFSIAKGIANLLLAIAVIAVPIFLIVMLFVL